MTPPRPTHRPARRRFLLATLGVGAAATGLGIGWSLMPPRQRLVPSQPLPAPEGERSFNGWLRIGLDGGVTVMVPKSEMGQGVLTGLAMVLADELDADWARVRVEHPPLDAIYNNLATVVDGLPFHPDDQGLVKRLAGRMTARTMREIGLMMTGGSSSMKDLWLPMREAGASARAMLVAAAAAQWGVPAAELRVDAGRVHHPSGRSAGFGELAEAAAKLPLPGAVALKTPAQFKLIGQPLPRLEARAKSTGSAGFGIDVLRPGMLYATVTMCPTLGGRVASFDGQAAMASPGVKKVLAVDGYAGGTAGVAVIADTPWHALKALPLVTVQWDEVVPAASFDSAAAMDQLARTLDQEDGFAFHRVGDVDAALAQAPKKLRAEYRAPWLAHMALEPMNCTVQFRDGRAEVWAPTQVPGLARRAVAQALGIEPERVEVHVTLLGGGFGRRLDVDFIGQAAAIARAAEGAPVQTFWSRAEDTQHDFYRPACVARFDAGFDAQGRLTAWRNVSAGQAIVPAVLERAFGLPGAGPDKTTNEGAFDQPYEWPAARIAHAAVQFPMPVGFWRAVGHSHQAFFKESFVDECAHFAGQDPVAFRLGLLARHPREAAVLKLAADKAGWGTPVPPAPDGAKAARGVALHHNFGSVVAQVAEVSLGPDGAIRVHRVVCAVDCGTPVNPNLIAQQMESGIVFGLSAAQHGEITVVRGRVVQSNFHDQPALRLAACPRIETHILPSDAHPEGVGEPGTPPIAPAVANALFALTGQRLRSLPLKTS
jgi:isoquinoline 1-oxidoreductase beta subunit